ncbi:MAG: hypothetical protein IKW06_03665 [Clostridia bacterium]|nr:hypothetical protein [Clostridia bacterium]
MNGQISVVELVKLFLFHWWRIVIVAVVGAMLAFGVTAWFVTPTYTSRGSLYVNNNTFQSNPNVNLADLATSQQLAFTCIELLKSDTFIEQIAEDLELPYSTTEIRGMISMEPKNETEIIEIKVRSHNPKLSQNMVDSILEDASDEIIRIVGGGNVKIVDYATFSQNPSSPNVLRYTFLGFVAGIFLSMFFIFLIDTFDTRIKIETDLMDIKELPLLGVIPDIEYIHAEVKKNAHK